MHTVFEFLAQKFNLGNGAQATVRVLINVEFKTPLLETEHLLYNIFQFTNSATFLSQDVMGVYGRNDDFGTNGSPTDLTNKSQVLSNL